MSFNWAEFFAANGELCVEFLEPWTYECGNPVRFSTYVEVATPVDVTREVVAILREFEEINWDSIYAPEEIDKSKPDWGQGFSYVEERGDGPVGRMASGESFAQEDFFEALCSVLGDKLGVPAAWFEDHTSLVGALEEDYDTMPAPEA